MLTFNNDIMGLQPSRSMAFMAKAKQMQATDPSVINLAGGEPDFDTPKKICDELFRQINWGTRTTPWAPGCLSCAKG